MKKMSFVFAALLGVGTLLSSCSDECCSCEGVTGFSAEVCEDDVPSGFDWDEYAETLEAAGCECD